jgi:hypothetical protein
MPSLIAVIEAMSSAGCTSEQIAAVAHRLENRGAQPELPLGTAPAKAARACRLPDGWRPSPEARQFSIDELGEQRAKNEFAKFCDYWRAKGGKDATKLDWNLTWRNWTRTAKERVGSAPAISEGKWLSTA